MNGSTKNPTTKTRRAIASADHQKTKRTAEAQKQLFNAHKMTAVPLLVLAIYCAYIAILSLPSFSQVFRQPLAILMFPPFPAIFVGTFSALAAYMLLKGKTIGRVATSLAWIFIVISLWLAFTWAVSNNPGSNPSQCEGLFGARQNCADVDYFQIALLFLNPISLGLYSLLSIVGITTMIARTKN